MVGTRAPQEGSITASLRELERLEEDRLRQESAARRQLHEADEAARRDAERRAEEERRARIRSEEEAWLARTRLEREEAARSAAMDRAIVEAAKTEAAARAHAAESEREHERQLERAAATEARALVRLRWVAGALAGSLAVVLAGGGLGYTRVVVPRWAERVEAARAEATARGATITDLSARLAAAEHDATAARRETAVPVSRAGALEAQATDLRREVDKLHHAKGASPSAPRQATMGFSTHCDPASGDPLCANIGR